MVKEREDRPWSERAQERVDLSTRMAELNPSGFRQTRTGKRKKARGKPPKTHLDRIDDLEDKLA